MFILPLAHHHLMTVVILVGSETGNSLDYATRASDDFLRLGLRTQVHLMDEFDLAGLVSEELEVLLFICSTTGDGEEPQNMRKFMKFLRRSNLPTNLFSSIKFGVFGLGDSSYEKFNFVGKRIYRRMQQLGAKDLIGFRGEGDEKSSKGLEGGWNIWLGRVVECLKDLKIIKNDSRLYKELEPLPPTCQLDSSNSQNISRDYKAKTDKLRVVECQRVTPVEHFQDTRLLKLKAEIAPEFIPGDILGLRPENHFEDVENVLNLMSWPGDLMIYGIKGEFLGNWSYAATCERYPMTLKEFIKRNVDLKRIPGRSTMNNLACLCDLSAAGYSQAHQDKLVELSRDEGEYLDYVWRPKRTLIEIISDFQPTLKIEISRLLQIFAPIKMRQFSVANDARDSGEFELLIALVEDKLPVGRGIRDGLCSGWIKNGIKSGDQICATLSRGSINFTSLSKSSKIFLFSAGTGIAPLRSIIQRLGRDETISIFLYFGFRMEKIDFYFRDEWREYKNLKMFSAGSRDFEGGKRVYLDELIKMNSGPLLELKSLESVSFVVTGHSRLPKLVLDVLKDVWKWNGDEEAILDRSLWADSLKGGNDRFQTETWS